MRPAGVVVVLLLVPVLIVALVWAVQRRLMYFPFADVPLPDAVGLQAVEQVTFETADGLRLRGWYLASRERTAPAVIVFNGNAGNRAYRAELGAALRQAGWSVLLFDYRGYGDSEGRPTEAGLYADARAARAFLAGRVDAGAPVVYVGESLGTGVALALALEQPPEALVLRSPFTSMADIAAVHYPVLPARWLLRDRYPALDRIPDLSAPLLVIAGDEDRIVPLTLSRRLYDAAPGRKAFVTIAGADHNDAALVHGPQVIGSIVDFVDRHAAPRSGPRHPSGGAMSTPRVSGHTSHERRQP